jgi:hypothetical protein
MEADGEHSIRAIRSENEVAVGGRVEGNMRGCQLLVSDLHVDIS